MSTILPPPPAGAPKGINVEGFVDRVISDFEGASQLPLTWEARQAVLKPANEHRDQIEAELLQGRAQLSDIEDAVQTVLRNALDMALRERATEIDEKVIADAMRMECKYFGWC